MNITDMMFHMCSHVGIWYLGSSQWQIIRLWAWKMYCHIFQYLDTCLKIHVTCDMLLCLEKTHLRHQELLTEWHTITSQKTWISSNTTMRISYLACFLLVCLWPRRSQSKHSSIVRKWDPPRWLHYMCDVANKVASVQTGQSRNHGLTPGSGLFSRASSLAPAPIQPPIQCVLGIFSLGVNGQEHEGGSIPLASPNMQSEWSNNSTPPCAFMVCTRTIWSYLSFSLLYF